MKRILLTFTAALLLGSSASAKTEVTFLYGIGGELGKAVESMVADFNASQSDVVVRPEFGNNYEGVVQKALAGIAAGQPAADVLHLEVSYVPRPRMFLAARRAVIIEWSWLLYLCIPFRPASSRFGNRESQARIVVRCA